MSQREELITKVAKKAGTSKRNAGFFLRILFEVIQAILARKGEFKLTGFGTFRAKAIPERKGIHPQTGRKVTFSPGVRVSFKPGAALKKALKEGIASSTSTRGFWNKSKPTIQPLTTNKPKAKGKKKKR